MENKFLHAIDNERTFTKEHYIYYSNNGAVRDSMYKWTLVSFFTFLLAQLCQSLHPDQTACGNNGQNRECTDRHKRNTHRTRLGVCGGNRVLQFGSVSCEYSRQRNKGGTYVDVEHDSGLVTGVNTGYCDEGSRRTVSTASDVNLAAGNLHRRL